jgi:cytoskeletal protein RodZ
MQPQEPQSTTDSQEVQVLTDEPPVQPTPVVVTPPLHKKRIRAIIVIVIIVLVVCAGVAYYLMTRSSTSQTESEQSASLRSATNAYTDGSSAESQFTQTDDSQLGNETSASAGTVGESVDENNL